MLLYAISGDEHNFSLSGKFGALDDTMGKRQAGRQRRTNKL